MNTKARREGLHRVPRRAIVPIDENQRRKASTLWRHFTSAQALSLLHVAILAALREGSGAATNDTLGEVAEERIRRRRKMLRVLQEGIHFLNHRKDTSEPKSLEPVPLGVQGRGLCELVNGQEGLFQVGPGQPTHDSIYLAGQISERWHQPLTPASIQKLVTLYGPTVVEDKLRELYEFPPEEAIRSPFAYLLVMLREGL